jgi:predicted nucleotidyltransferase
MTRDEIIQALRQAKKDLFNRYPLKSLAVFGSVARGEATMQSDLDVLVEFSEPVGFEIVDLAIELEEIVQQKVDVVSRKGLKPALIPLVERDLLYV